MIAIKNMEMPKSCYDCPFAENERTNDYGSFCECGILEDCETINLLEYSIHPNCPLTEIITCKDCKYYRVEDDDEYCTNHTIKDNKFWVREDYFCADGERRK